MVKGKDMDFDSVVEFRIEQIRKTLQAKGKEYATESDRFHNFNVAGKMNKTTPEKALKGMMAKHEVSVVDLIEYSNSVMDLIEHVEYDPDRLTEALVNEKIGDNINYLILLEGMLKQRIEKMVEPLVDVGIDRIEGDRMAIEDIKDAFEEAYLVAGGDKNMLSYWWERSNAFVIYTARKKVLANTQVTTEAKGNVEILHEEGIKK
jgi:hypothetical protein